MKVEPAMVIALAQLAHSAEVSADNDLGLEFGDFRKDADQVNKAFRKLARELRRRIKELEA